MSSENTVEPCLSKEHWWSTIRHLAKQFGDVMSERGINDGVSFQYDAQKLETALNIYEQGWRFYKDRVYGANAHRERIDRHKIASLYTLAFLTAKPFSVSFNPQKEITDKRILAANELFSLVIVKAIIEAWSKNGKTFEIKTNEKKWFVILLNHLNSKLERSSISNATDEYNVLSLSQIIYYLEKSHIEA